MFNSIMGTFRRCANGNIVDDSAYVEIISVPLKLGRIKN